MEFNEVYTKYYVEIENQIKYKIKNQEDAEDLALEIFVKVHAKMDSFNEDIASIRTWIWRIAKNHVIDYKRKLKNKLRTESIDETYDNDDNEVIQLIDSSDPQKDMETAEIGDQILDAIIQLPSSVSEVAEQYFIAEKTYKEIADGLAIPMGTVKAHIHRAKQCLRIRLKSFR